MSLEKYLTMIDIQINNKHKILLSQYHNKNLKKSHTIMLRVKFLLKMNFQNVKIQIKKRSNDLNLKLNYK